MKVFRPFVIYIYIYYGETCLNAPYLIWWSLVSVLSSCWFCLVSYTLLHNMLSYYVEKIGLCCVCLYIRLKINCLKTFLKFSVWCDEKMNVHGSDLPTTLYKLLVGVGLEVLVSIKWGSKFMVRKFMYMTRQKCIPLFISRRVEGPGREILQRPPSVCPLSVRHI